MPGRFAEDALAEAERRSRRVVDSVDVTAEVVHQPPAEAMVHAVSRTAMICLDPNGAHHAHPGHGAGTATEVLLTADCPVAVVRGYKPDHGWVVVRVGPRADAVRHPESRRERGCAAGSFTTSGDAVGASRRDTTR